MRSKIIAIVVATVIFILILGIFFFSSQEKISEEKAQATQKEVKQTYLTEGESCEIDGDKECLSGYFCEDGICLPKLDYKEIIDPEQDKDLYDVAMAGPYKNDYILHVDRLVISEKLYVWIGNKKKPIWFNARREKELRPYEIEVPKGNSIRIKLSNRDKLHPPEFRGKIYLTKP